MECVVEWWCPKGNPLFPRGVKEGVSEMFIVVGDYSPKSLLADVNVVFCEWLDFGE